MIPSGPSTRPSLPFRTPPNPYPYLHSPAKLQPRMLAETAQSVWGATLGWYADTPKINALGTSCRCVCASRSSSHIKNTWTSEVSHSRSRPGRGCGFIGQRHGIHVRITRSNDVTPIPHLTLSNLLSGVICSIVLYTGAMYSTRVPVSHGLDWLDPEY